MNGEAKFLSRCSYRFPARGEADEWVRQPERCHPGRRQPIRDLVPQSPKGSPRSACAAAGMTGYEKRPLNPPNAHP